MLNRQLAVAMTLVVIGGVAVPVRAQAPSSVQSAGTAPQQTSLVQLGSARRSSSFQRLFVLPGDRTLGATPLVQQPVLLEKPRVVCGMTVIPVDPTIDPKMRVEQKSGNLRFTIRTIPPPMCK